MPFIDKKQESSYIHNIAYRPYELESEFMNDISLNILDEGTTADERQISQSIFNVLLTLKSERLFNIGFGTNIYRYLFQPATYITSAAIETEARNSILAVEKRILIKSEDISATVNQDEHYIDIEIRYKIKSTAEFGSWKQRLYL